MRISILTVCPELFAHYQDNPVVARASALGCAEVEVVDVRSFADGCFRKVDDSPYGGGAGMILRCQPMVDAMRDCEARFLAENRESVSGGRQQSLPQLSQHSSPPLSQQTSPRQRSLRVALSPAGKCYNQADALRYAKTDHLILLCGHYEGMDERIYSYTDEIISIGDYVLTGGEVAARVVVDSVLRLLREVIRGESLEEESFTGGLLEYPQYTRPAEYEGKRVPDVLLSGNHGAIKRWREEEAVRLTRQRRPDMH